MSVSFNNKCNEKSIFTIISSQSRTWLFEENLGKVIDNHNLVNINYSFENSNVCYTDNPSTIISKIKHICNDKIIKELQDLLENIYIEDIENNIQIIKINKEKLEEKLNVDVQIAIEQKFKYKIWLFENKIEKYSENYFVFSYNIEHKQQCIASDFFIIQSLAEINDKFKEIEIVIDYYFSNKINLIEPKNYDILLNSAAAGILFHEFIGHLLEEDHYFKSPNKEFPKKEIIYDNLQILENFNVPYDLDDFGMPIHKNICLINEGEVINLLSSNSTNIIYGTKNTGNNIQGENILFVYPRMRHMYVDSKLDKIPKDKIWEFFYEGIYITKLNMGEVNTFTGDFSVEVQMSYLVEDGKLKTKLEPFFLNFNIEMLKRMPIYLSDDYSTQLNLCGKNGSIVKVHYTMPSIILKNSL